MTDATHARIEELAALVRQHRDAYYNGHPILSDAAFDALEDELRALEPEHPVLGEVGAPVRAGAAVTEWDKARHAIPMGSLNKVVNEEELRKWATRCDELAAAEGLPLVSPELFVTEKLDGISLEVIYENGVYADAITRGDGLVGERISPNVKRMKGVPSKLPEPVSLSVRGEIILFLSDFHRHFPDNASPRNTAAGTSKRFDGKGCEHLSVLFYDFEGGEEARSEVEKMSRLESLGLRGPGHRRADTAGVIALMTEYAERRRRELDYEIDGLVVRANDVRAQHILGELHHRPRAAVAFKFGSPQAISTVREILWETGPTGRVTPVALVDPVELASARVRRASLHNVSNVQRLGVAVGDEVLVSRRNDVIPYVEEVVVRHAEPAPVPIACGTCAAPLAREGEYLLCRNRECTARVEGRIHYWIRAQGILEWGDRLVEQLVDGGLAREPADLYRLKWEDIAALERRGEIIAKKIVANLRAALPVTLPVFLTALGIPGFGLQTAKLLVDSGYDSLEKLRAASEEQLASIPGLGTVKAKLIVQGLQGRADEIARLAAVGVVPVAASAGGRLAGKSFCFTGAMSRPRKELEQLVIDAGGNVLTSVTKGLDYLVMTDPTSASSKAEKARKYGTECISEQSFVAMLAPETNRE